MGFDVVVWAGVTKLSLLFSEHTEDDDNVWFHQDSFRPFSSDRKATQLAILKYVDAGDWASSQFFVLASIREPFQMGLLKFVEDFDRRSSTKDFLTDFFVYTNKSVGLFDISWYL